MRSNGGMRPMPVSPAARDCKCFPQALKFSTIAVISGKNFRKFKVLCALLLTT